MSAFACLSTEYVKGLTKVKEKMIKIVKRFGIGRISGGNEPDA